MLSQRVLRACKFGQKRIRVLQAAIHCSRQAVTDEVTTESLNMHREDVMPFCPIQDALLLDFQVFGDLPKSDSEAVARNERLTKVLGLM